jgi:hypothetical protein
MTDRETTPAPQQTSILGHRRDGKKNASQRGRQRGRALVACWSGREALSQLGKFLFRHTSLASNRTNANSPKGLFLFRQNSRVELKAGAFKKRINCTAIGPAGILSFPPAA